MEEVLNQDSGNTEPILAICYDFDKTLSPDNMQAQGYIQSVGQDVGEFWKESDRFAKAHEMDPNLSYMLLMVQKAKGRFPMTKDALALYGKRIEFFPGVEKWFDRMNAYGASHHVRVEHYIISSGLKEMIAGTSIAGKFERIYASSFCFDEAGMPLWPAQVVNYTNKTQFLFRIEKGVLDVNNDRVNEQMPDEEVRVPFRNMVYIGDSETDVPCMTVVNARGGYSVGVYGGDKENVYRMIRERRIQFFAPADYREGKELDVLVKRIIEKTEITEKLAETRRVCEREVL
jgi:hypothetical protein